jgi:hypothetical protein
MRTTDSANSYLLYCEFPTVKEPESKPSLVIFCCTIYAYYVC